MRLKEAKERFERAYLQEVMVGRNVAQAARYSGCNRTAFYKKLKKYGLSYLDCPHGNSLEAQRLC